MQRLQASESRNAEESCPIAVSGETALATSAQFAASARGSGPPWTYYFWLAPQF
jgi:hypothetical protein